MQPSGTLSCGNELALCPWQHAKSDHRSLYMWGVGVVRELDPEEGIKTSSRE